MLHLHPNPTHPTMLIGGRYQAVVRCPHCQWGATLTSADGNEIHEFLIRKLAEHWTEQHPLAEQRM